MDEPGYQKLVSYLTTYDTSNEKIQSCIKVALQCMKPDTNHPNAKYYERSFNEFYYWAMIYKEIVQSVDWHPVIIRSISAEMPQCHISQAMLKAVQFAAAKKFNGTKEEQLRQLESLLIHITKTSSLQTIFHVSPEI